MGRGRYLGISYTWLCSTGLGSNEGDEECYEIISAPALRHKLGLNLPPDRSLMLLCCEVSLSEEGTPLNP